jgi:hypothetical protein
VTARAQWRWLAWATGILGGFAVIEHAAYTTGAHPTLTKVLRYHLGIAPARPDRTVRAAVAAGAVAGGLVVLAVHLARVPAEEPIQPVLRLVA